MFSTGPQTRLRGVFLIVVAPLLLLTGCPPEPPCPNCTVKTGAYKIPDESALPSGFTISDAELTHDVDYRSHCPDPPSGETPPCQRSDSKSVMPVRPGDEDETKLIFATDSNQDNESAEIKLTLTRTGQPNQTVTVPVTVQ